MSESTEWMVRMTRRALTTKHTLYLVRLSGGSLQDDGHESIVLGLFSKERSVYGVLYGDPDP